MPHDDPQLREVVTDLVEVHHVLAVRRHPRPGDAGVGDDRNVEIDAGLVDRVVPPVAHRDLRVASGGKRRDRDLMPCSACASRIAAHCAADVVRVHLEAGDEALGVALEGVAL